MRALETLSHKQRRATPPGFAMFLLTLVAKVCGRGPVASQWVEEDTVYRNFPHVDPWPASRDAYRWPGGMPIVAHPPCGPWGNYRSVNKESKDHGAQAMDYVHRFGGVVEHPVGSSLFESLGAGGRIIVVDQGNFGHLAQKRTKLYVCRPGQCKRLFN